MRKNVVLHHFFGLLGPLLAVHKHGTRVVLLAAGDDVEERALAGARRAHEHNKLAWDGGARNIVEDDLVFHLLGGGVLDLDHLGDMLPLERGLGHIDEDVGAVLGRLDRDEVLVHALALHGNFRNECQPPPPPIVPTSMQPYPAPYDGHSRLTSHSGNTPLAAQTLR
ncbi:hypothetical protein ACHHYP_20654 [Achlya hypogyna]|uniref:Secreted protein n=1 Tax=Achlya hypogyna TaxID=1202772 RepID=A0A1V9YFQ6_ACHHY|nr:hypothetical protein ACHHYP_20654 [Achlya hypogyna]